MFSSRFALRCCLLLLLHQVVAIGTDEEKCKVIDKTALSDLNSVYSALLLAAALSPGCCHWH
jgi:Na+-translocating ferredoxin:NAD+ oxidoreductase RnfD subunit